MAGAFDALEPNRALVKGNVDLIMGEANRRGADAAIGMIDMFGGADVAPQLPLRAAAAWTPMEKLQQEFDAIGFFLSGHPLDQYEKVLAKLGVRRFTDFEALAEQGAKGGRLAGIVIAARERRSQKGNKFAFAMFSDTSGQFEAVIFSDTLAQAGNLLKPGTPLLLDGGSRARRRDAENARAGYRVAGPCGRGRWPWFAAGDGSAADEAGGRQEDAQAWHERCNRNSVGVAVERGCDRCPGPLGRLARSGRQSFDVAWRTGGSGDLRRLRKSASCEARSV